MSALRRTLAAGAATGALGALLIAGSAQAASGDRAACAVQGKASTNPNMLMTGGSGSYAFATAASISPLMFTCVVNSGTRVDVQQFAAPSTGTFANIVCGTGTMTSTPGTKGFTIGAITEVGPHPPLPDLTNVWFRGGVQQDFSYAVQYVGGQGVVTFGPGDVTGGGPVSLTFDLDATNPAPPAGCTNHFELQGAVVFTVN